MTEPTKEQSVAAEFNLAVVLRAPACYVADHHGQEKLSQIVEASGLTLSDLDGKTHWGSLEQCEAFLAQLYELVGRDDRAFVDTSGYNLAQSLGPLRYVLLAGSPKFIFERAVKEFPVVSNVSRQELGDLSEQSCTIRYFTTKQESRLLCLSRLGSIMAVPTIWGLPKAELKETTCVARGDACCEYHLRWQLPPRKFGALLGVLLGGVALLGGFFVDAALQPWFWTSAAALPLLGYLLSVLKANRANLLFSDKMAAETRDVIHADAEARREILRLNERQRAWEKIVTTRGVEAIAEKQRLVEKLADLQSRLATSLRGYGHDIATPLTVLKTHGSVLKRSADSIPRSEVEEILKHNDEAIERVNRLVGEMMAAAKAQSSLKNVVPRPIDVREMASQLQSRVRAFVHGKPIEASVQIQEPVPQTITTDSLMLDRILDNLLMNAAKYTHEGRVDVFIAAGDGEFAVVVRDTGRGIAPDEMSRIIEPEGSDAATRAPGSFGLGLSVVTELLEELGGRLEVESEPEKGSSFRIVLPVGPSRDGSGGDKPATQSAVLA